MDAVTKEMRRHAKVINFGILYGMGVNALKKNLGGTQKEAAAFYADYFKQFKNFEIYLEDTKQFARTHGYTETLFGRRRYFGTINSSVPFIQKMAERTAINAPIQGTLADIVKLAMRFIDERLRAEGLAQDVHLILQIHDELIFEIKKEALEKASQIIKEEMEGVLPKSYIHFESPVPIIVDSSSGSTWQEL
jgi:DNA polymerase-1